METEEECKSELESWYRELEKELRLRFPDAKDEGLETHAYNLGNGYFLHWIKWSLYPIKLRRRDKIIREWKVIGKNPAKLMQEANREIHRKETVQ